MVSITCKTFGDMVSIAEARAKIAGDSQPDNRDFIKGAINEYYLEIATERPWKWRKFDRTLNFNPAITTGTVEVTQDSRIITFTGFAIQKKHIGRSIKITGTKELYRIIGANTNTNQAYLDAAFVGSSNALATFKLYKYEFALPPDLDTLDMVYIDTGGITWHPSYSGELDSISVLLFNRYLSTLVDYVDEPTMYTIDGESYFNDGPPLGEMVLGYDFLGGTETSTTSRLRLFPIEPTERTVIRLNYSRIVRPMEKDTDEPLLPLDERFMLVHYALGEWHSANNSGAMADREFKKADNMLAVMRQEHRKTDTKPRFMVNGGKFLRRHIYPANNDKFILARLKEKA